MWKLYLQPWNTLTSLNSNRKYKTPLQVQIFFASTRNRMTSQSCSDWIMHIFVKPVTESARNANKFHTCKQFVLATKICSWKKVLYLLEFKLLCVSKVQTKSNIRWTDLPVCNHSPYRLKICAQTQTLQAQNILQLQNFELWNISKTTQNFYRP